MAVAGVLILFGVPLLAGVEGSQDGVLGFLLRGASSIGWLMIFGGLGIAVTKERQSRAAAKARDEERETL